MRLPISFPSSHDCFLINPCLLSPTTVSVSLDKKLAAISDLIRMIRSGKLVLGVHYDWRLLLPQELNIHKYSIDDLEGILGGHIAKVFIDAFLLYKEHLPPDEDGGAKQIWLVEDTIKIEMPSISEDEYWRIEGIYYDLQKDTLMMGIRRDTFRPKARKSYYYEFDLVKGNDYIDSPGISIYDMLAQIGIWFFSSKNRGVYLMYALNRMFGNHGNPTMIWHILLVEEGAAQQEGVEARKIDSDKMPSITGTQYRSSVFVLARQASISEGLVVMGSVTYPGAYQEGKHGYTNPYWAVKVNGHDVEFGIMFVDIALTGKHSVSLIANRTQEILYIPIARNRIQRDPLSHDNFWVSLPFSDGFYFDMYARGSHDFYLKLRYRFFDGGGRGEVKKMVYRSLPTGGGYVMELIKSIVKDGLPK